MARPPLQRNRFQPVRVTPKQGGQLLTNGISAEEAGLTNYTVKRDWRRDQTDEMRREGFDNFRPNLSIPVGRQPFPEVQTLTGITSTVCVPVHLVINPSDGSTVDYPVLVTITADNPNATIYYSLDGSTPDQTKFLYEGSFRLSEEGLTIKAVAIIEQCGTPGADVVFVPYQATAWRYLQIGFAEDPPIDYSLNGFDDSAWGVGQAGFGSTQIGNSPCPLQSTIHTNWTIDTRIVLRKHFTLPVGVSNLRIGLAVDNDVIALYFNGHLVASNLHHDFCPTLDNFQFRVEDSQILVGANVIALVARDLGGQSFFDLTAVGFLT